PYPSSVFEEVSSVCYGGIAFGDIGEHASLPPRPEATPPRPTPPSDNPSHGQGLRLATYRPLFSGPAVERTPELHFQQPAGEIDITRADARARGIAGGDMVKVSSNGTSVALRARIANDLTAGTVRVAQPDAGELHGFVEVRK